ncbi:hypothetical protein Patl1_20368 [Pistacia atlantica]|uniref:Uncharacterized protein n=1 Tax=Pistacia atlantica TaxID=434234 RepID=A0ACC1BLH3_9ROSI|nr:hypothetical protein Patl1_20368 [Pistacia atlantica]
MEIPPILGALAVEIGDTLLLKYNSMDSCSRRRLPINTHSKSSQRKHILPDPTSISPGVKAPSSKAQKTSISTLLKPPPTQIDICH